MRSRIVATALLPQLAIVLIVINWWREFGEESEANSSEILMEGNHASNCTNRGLAPYSQAESSPCLTQQESIAGPKTKVKPKI